jgi:hypothetical protein
MGSSRAVVVVGPLAFICGARTVASAIFVADALVLGIFDAPPKAHPTETFGQIMTGRKAFVGRAPEIEHDSPQSCRRMNKVGRRWDGHVPSLVINA